MEVILLERTAKLGQMGEIIKVRDGFARNSLIPQGRALRATPSNKARFEAERSMHEARSLERKARAQETASTLMGRTFTAIRAAGATGQLYGSMNARGVADIISSEGFDVNRNQIALRTPIKVIGLHTVLVRLHPDVELELEINIARTLEEAGRQAKGENLPEDIIQSLAIDTISEDHAKAVSL